MVKSNSTKLHKVEKCGSSQAAADILNDDTQDHSDSDDSKYLARPDIQHKVNKRGSPQAVDDIYNEDTQHHSDIDEIISAARKEIQAPPTLLIQQAPLLNGASVKSSNLSSPISHSNHGAVGPNSTAPIVPAPSATPDPSSPDPGAYDHMVGRTFRIVRLHPVVDRRFMDSAGISIFKCVLNVEIVLANGEPMVITVWGPNANNFYSFFE